MFINYVFHLLETFLHDIHHKNSLVWLPSSSSLIYKMFLQIEFLTA